MDLSFAQHILYTYQCGNDSSVTSWIDNVLCDSLSTARVPEVKCLNFGSNHSDHIPVDFTIEFEAILALRIDL